MSKEARIAAANNEPGGAAIARSEERIRDIVENDGRRVLKARDKGLIGPDWRASDCQVSSDGPSHGTVCPSR